METEIKMTRLLKLLLPLLSLALLCGCATKGAITSYTSTVFGVEIAQNPQGLYTLKAGLIRGEYNTVPLATNGAAPNLVIVTDAQLRPLGEDRIHRAFATGQAVDVKATENWFGNVTTNRP
jgi:hypothetical protein